ncbi:MAG TPA: AtpZ/AtpI family protein [Candidatus Eremiobacteraceae bacterium]|nr:AtpZ/AtpI family protein [Candidatus Eremiobacteraceae bacterium]
MPSDNSNKTDPKPESPGQHAAGFSRQFAMAMELPFILVASIGVGGVIGYFMDNWLHTKPYLMLLFGLLGFVAGLRDMLRRAAKE